MERINLSNVVVENIEFEKLNIFFDDESKVVFLPLLWVIQLTNTELIYRWVKRGNFSGSNAKFGVRSKSLFEKTFEGNPVSPNTVKNYIGHLFQFLKYINEQHLLGKSPSVHNTELISSRFINDYLNNILPNKLNSVASLVAHQSAISAYFGFLFELELKELPASTIYRKTNQLMAEKDLRQKKTNYISKSERSALISHTTSIRDQIIIRLGFEVGLRTEENTGLELNGKKTKYNHQKGLLSLFDELDNSPNKMSFEYVLQGKYTKGGKTRNIYFERDLLSLMKRYFFGERLEIMQNSSRVCESLLVRADPVGLGMPINAGHASNVFSILRTQCDFMNQNLSYHDLRHTFATELYHSELLDSAGHETRSESAAMLVVAERLGHKSLKSTIRYIRLRHQMLIIESAHFE
ncbi:MAG: site-specific integrase [Methylotenera sp.]|nr:site-specific integrase [Methylotenera sp.]